MEPICFWNLLCGKKKVKLPKKICVKSENICLSLQKLLENNYDL